MESGVRNQLLVLRSSFNKLTSGSSEETCSSLWLIEEKNSYLNMILIFPKCSGVNVMKLLTAK